MPSAQSRLISNFFIWGTVASVVGVGVGIWVSRTLTAPLSKLAMGVEAIEQQDFSYRLSVKGNQGMVALANAFNRMAGRLEQAEKQRPNLLAELRYPIHLLQGNLQAILDDIYPLDKAEIARLSDHTHHLATLINDLQELAQAEAKQLPLHKQPTDLASLMAETVGWWWVGELVEEIRHTPLGFQLE